MKTILGLMLAILFSGAINAQNYTFYDTGAVWGQYYIGNVGNPIDINNSSMRHISNDTINGKVYARVDKLGPRYTNYRILMFRDSAGYVYRSYLDTIGGINTIRNETLTYNFNLQVNDTFLVYSSFGAIKMVVRSITNVTLLDGSVRKQLTFVDNPAATYPISMKWVEGIGDINRGLTGITPNIDSGWGLICYSSANGIAIDNNYWNWLCDGNLLAGGFHPGTIFADMNISNPICGTNSGYLVLGAYGGNGPFTFNVNGRNYNAGDTVFGLSSGGILIDIYGSTNSIQQMYVLQDLADSDHDIDSVHIVSPTCGLNNGSVTIFSNGTYRYSLNYGSSPQVSNHFDNVRAGTFNLHVSDSSGCIDVWTVVIKQQGNPSIDSLLISQPPCGATQGAITILANNPGNHLTYSIDNGQTYQANSTFSSLGLGTYNIVISDTAGCVSDTSSFVIVADTVNVNTSIAVNTITAEAIGASYQWLSCDNSLTVIASATSQSFIPTADGNYAVAITDILSGCVDTSACKFVSAVGINTITTLQDVSLYPNPNAGIFTIGMGQKLSGTVTITNTLGQMVKQMDFEQTDKLNLDLDVEAGVYFVSVKTLQGNAVRRLIVE